MRADGGCTCAYARSRQPAFCAAGSVLEPARLLLICHGLGQAAPASRADLLEDGTRIRLLRLDLRQVSSGRTWRQRLEDRETAKVGAAVWMRKKAKNARDSLSMQMAGPGPGLAALI